ncbi:MAG: alanine racemase [Bacteroidetes bacterium]|nr:alanine racemase [Bacteroidota bacterium]
MKITKPTLLLDAEKCKTNIQQMAAKARKHNLVFRPHFKTHQSLEIGRWFREAGVQKITVSSVSMADYFSQEWEDITIAFPVNVLEIDTINRLASKIRLNLLVESLESLAFLAEKLTHHVGFFIKIDTGAHRTGIQPNNIKLLEKLASFADTLPNLEWCGFLAHSGHTYSCRDRACVDKIHRESLQLLSGLKNHFKDRYPHIVNSLGDTPACSLCDKFVGVDEIRPGNFVFYDLTQAAIGACETPQIALAMACPVVALHPEREEVIVYGGGVHFSKDRLQTQHHGVIYGRVVEKTANGWGAVLPDVYVKNLSQEHGVVHMSKKYIDQINIGDLLYVLPVHACMTADVMKTYRTIGETDIKMMR